MHTLTLYTQRREATKRQMRVWKRVFRPAEYVNWDSHLAYANTYYNACAFPDIVDVIEERAPWGDLIDYWTVPTWGTRRTRRQHAAWQLPLHTCAEPFDPDCIPF